MLKTLILALCSVALFAQTQFTPNYPYPLPFPQQNDTTTGTSLFKTADLSAGNAITSNHTNVSGAIGVVVGNAGTTGSSYLSFAGPTPLFVDATSTVGHCVVRSVTSDGEGHDTGSACTSPPATGEFIGIVVTASTGANSLSTVLLKGAFNPGNTAHTISAPLNCSSVSVSATAYTCTTTPTFTPVKGDTIYFCPDVASGVSPTLNVNASSAAPIKLQQGQVNATTNDLRAAPACVDMTYDGTNWLMQGQGGNAAGGGGGGGSHTVFINMGGIVSAGGFNDSVNCTVASNTGLSALTGDVDGPLGPVFAQAAAAYIACWIDLSSWDGNALTMRFYSMPASGGLGGGTVVWSAATSCKTFSTTATSFGTTYGTASNANSYAASVAFNTYMTSVAIPLTGCTAGSGKIMTIKIKRATDTETTGIALTGVSITGVF